MIESWHSESHGMKYPLTELTGQQVLFNLESTLRVLWKTPDASNFKINIVTLQKATYNLVNDFNIFKVKRKVKYKLL